jgi:hypothetical protein
MNDYLDLQIGEYILVDKETEDVIATYPTYGEANANQRRGQVMVYYARVRQDFKKFDAMITMNEETQ